MSELFPPAAARFTSDVSPYVEGLAKANGATRDWQAELAKAGTAAQKAGTTAEAASNRAATAMRRAADAAGLMAKANAEAATAAQKLAAGELSQEEAAGAATKASRAQTTALEAQQRASIATQRAAAASADATRASAAVQSTAAAKSNAAWASVATGLNKVGKGATIALAAIGIESVHLAGNFQQQTNVLVTAAGELPKNLGLVRDGILNIAETTGTAWQQVTTGVYVAEKAGYRGADALNVVKASAQGAREEQVDLGTELSAVTSIMASYHLKASDAVSVVNQLKTAGGESKATMEQFAASLSTVLPIASAVGLNFAQVAGAEATLTQHGTTTNEATQELAGTIKALANPTNVATQEMAQFGLSSVTTSSQLGKVGLQGTLEELSNAVLTRLGPAGTVLLDTFNQSKTAAAAAQTEFEALPAAAQKLAAGFENGTVSASQYRTQSRALTGEQSVLAQQFYSTYTQAHGFQNALKNGGPAAQTYIAAISKMTGGTTGLNTLLQLTGGSAGGLTERVNAVSKAAQGAGKDVSGWESTQKLFNVRLDEFKQQAEATGIRIGEQLIPPVQKLLGLLSRHPAVLHDIVTGLELMSAAWLGLKIAGWISSVGSLAGRLLGVSTAARAAAVSTDALAVSEGLAGRAGAVEGAGLALGAGRSLPAMGGNFVGKAGAAGAAGAGEASIAGAAGPIGLGAAALLGVEIYGQKAIDKGARPGTPQAAKFLNLESFFPKNLKQQISTVSAAYGQSAGEDFAINLAKTNGDVKAAWQKTYKVIPGAKLGDLVVVNGTIDQAASAFKRGQLSAEGFWQKVSDQKAIATFQDGLKNSVADLNSNTNSLLGNSKGAESNRNALVKLVGQAQTAARSYSNITGNADDYSRSLNLAIPKIEAAAVATGLNKQQVDALVNSITGLHPKSVPVGVTGTAEAQAEVGAFLQMLSLIPPQVLVPIRTFIENPTAANQLAGSAFGIDTTGAPKTQAAGGIYPRGVPGGIVQWAEAGGESYIPLAPAKRSRSLGLWAQTGRMLGVPMAEGGIIGGDGGSLQDLAYALAVTGNLTGIENQRAKYNTANFKTATAANVPALQLAAEQAAASAKLVGGIFNASKHTLYGLAHSGSAAQRKSAGTLYNLLSGRAGQLSTDAHVEEGLLASLRGRYAGQEALTATPGPATRDLSYLALHGAPTASGPSHVNVTVVSQLDGKEIARSTSKVQLRTERRNLSNGATKIRNR